ncbi:hypothetical protein ABFV83_02150 [Lacrimispora sp. BS-2]|uniref:Uncharacterized protein n=1 Tax=Lacrimispora sp. BS-2 TaxID=3151850 RepID=A0AAU7PQX7_9FIRM
MMDKDCLDYYLKELGNRKGSPYGMANEALADEFFPYVKAEFQDAIMVKQGIGQYIVVTKRARTALLKRFQVSKLEHEKAISEIDGVIQTLKAETPGAATPRESR